MTTWLFDNWGLPVCAVMVLGGIYVQIVLGRSMDRQTARAATAMLEHDQQSLELIDLVAQVRPELAERAEAQRAAIESLHPNLLRMADGKTPSAREMWRRGRAERRDRRAMRKLRRQVESVS